MFGVFTFGQPYFGQAPILVVVAIPPNVIEAFGSYDAFIEAMGSQASHEAMGAYDASVEAFGSKGEV